MQTPVLTSAQYGGSDGEARRRRHEFRTLFERALALTEPGVDMMTLRVDGLCMYVHEAILQARCTSLYELLKVNSDVSALGFSHEAWQTLLEYLYTNGILYQLDQVKASVERARDVIQIADRFGLTRLHMYVAVLNPSCCVGAGNSSDSGGNNLAFCLASSSAQDTDAMESCGEDEEDDWSHAPSVHDKWPPCTWEPDMDRLLASGTGDVTFLVTSSPASQPSCSEDRSGGGVVVTLLDSSTPPAVGEKRRLRPEDDGDDDDDDDFVLPPRKATRAESQRGVNAHRAILCARSTFFTALFEGALRSNESVIEYNGPEHVLHIVLRYIYVGFDSKVQDMLAQDPQVVLQVLLLSNQYMIEGLQSRCEWALSKWVSTDNVLTILEIIAPLNCPLLRCFCMYFAVTRNVPLRDDDLACDGSLRAEIIRLKESWGADAVSTDDAAGEVVAQVVEGDEDEDDFVDERRRKFQRCIGVAGSSTRVPRRVRFQATS